MDCSLQSPSYSMSSVSQAAAKSEEGRRKDTSHCLLMDFQAYNLRRYYLTLMSTCLTRLGRWASFEQRMLWSTWLRAECGGKACLIWWTEGRSRYICPHLAQAFPFKSIYQHDDDGQDSYHVYSQVTSLQGVL